MGDSFIPLNAVKFGKPEESRMKIYLECQVIDKISEFTNGVTDKERGGALLGAVVGNDTLIIDEVIPATRAIEKSAAVTFTGETMEQINYDREHRYPNHKILGWFHTHPGYGVYFAPIDMNVAQTYFNRGAQVSFVIDPVGRMFGFFEWKSAQMVESPGFYLYSKVGDVPKIYRGYKLEYRRANKELRDLNRTDKKVQPGRNVFAFSAVAMAALIIILTFVFRQTDSLRQPAGFNNDLASIQPSPDIQGSPDAAASPETVPEQNTPDPGSDVNIADNTDGGITPDNLSPVPPEASQSPSPQPGTAPTNEEMLAKYDDEIRRLESELETVQNERAALEKNLTDNIDKIRQERIALLDAMSRKHVVTAGDTFVDIARQYYNDPSQYRRILEANNLQSNSILQVGQVLIIP